MLRNVLTPVLVVLTVIALLVVFTIREPDTNISKPGYYSAVCIEGVKYYSTGYKLAPAVDAETLTFIRCEVK